MIGVNWNSQRTKLSWFHLLILTIMFIVTVHVQSANQQDVSTGWYLLEDVCDTLKVKKMPFLLKESASCIMMQKWNVLHRNFCSYSMHDIHSFSSSSSDCVPTRLFRTCASCCGIQRWHALHMFIESLLWQSRMEPMVLVTSEWFLHSFSSSEFWLWPYFHFTIGHIVLHQNYCV